MYEMTEKIYLNFFILCGILSHGIIVTLAERNITEGPLHLLIRNKRLVSSHPDKVQKTSLDYVPHVVQLRRNNLYACVGNIILPQVILTAAHCLNDPGTYNIWSGSSFTNHGIRHNITAKIIHPQYHPPSLANDLVLLYIDPHIDIIHSPNRPIILNHGFIPQRTIGLVSGWGCIQEDSNTRTLPLELRSIMTTIISQEQCHNFHHGIQHQRISITDKDICTNDIVYGNRCSLGDSGAPLDVSNRLAGILSWNRPAGGPDVFVNLSHPVYRNWILKHLPSNPYL